MKYLEEKELEIGKNYIYVPYSDSKERLILTYVGNDDFINNKKEVLSFHGDIRYCLSEWNGNEIHD
jgi:hypothetical protein